MPDIITDRRITQDEAGQMMAPMELDLLALFKVMEQNILTGMEDFKGTPEEYIDKVMKDISGMNETEVLKAIEQKESLMKNKNIQKACKPGPGEKQNDFISRCIKEEMGKGTPQDEAKGKCYGIWQGKKAKESLFKSLSTVLKGLIGRIK